MSIDQTTIELQVIPGGVPGVRFSDGSQQSKLRLALAMIAIKMSAIKWLIALIVVFATSHSAKAEFIISSTGSASESQQAEGLLGSSSAVPRNSSRESDDHDDEPLVLNLASFGLFGLAGGHRGGCSSTDSSSSGSSASSSFALMPPGNTLARSECQGRLSLASLRIPPRPDPLEMLDPPKLAR